MPLKSFAEEKVQHFPDSEWADSVMEAEIRPLPWNSMAGRPGLAVGIQSEKETIKFLPPPLDYVATWNYEYDIIWRNLRIDVKSLETSRRYCIPLDDLADIPKRQYDQHACDVYLMTRVNVSLRTCWLMGWIFKENLLDRGKGRLQVKDSKNEINNTNDFTYGEDTYVIEYGKLEPMYRLKEI